jgi:catechol 2,3-dioxygenase-like lactoylglutathione lyase family enzyme
MRIEHFAYIVKEPVETAQWYCKHLGLKVMRSLGAPNFTHFLGDAEGHVLIEIYTSPQLAVPEYAEMDPLVVHLAFAVDDVRNVRGKLLRAGAKPEGHVTTNDAGDELAILRDPWGFAIQLMKRKEPMLAP